MLSNTAAGNLPAMDKIREELRAHIKALNISESEASRRIGQHRGYVHEFLSGKQATLPYEVKLAFHEKLAMPLSKLGITNLGSGNLAQTPPGMADDAVLYTGPRSHDFAGEEAISEYIMMSDALENHPLRIAQGDRLIFDLSPAAVSNLPSEKIVIAQCYPLDTQVMSAKTIVREFIRPSLLVTNRRSQNEIISLSDPNAEFEVVIKGTFRRLVRE